MPIWFRNRPSELADPTEQVVAERLNRLSDEWRICWGYYYNPNGDQGHSREGDFIIQGPHGHILVMEVKGGQNRQFLLTGRWEGQDDGDNPLEQLNSEWRAILDRVKEVAGEDNAPYVAKALCMPNLNRAGIERLASQFQGVGLITGKELENFEGWWKARMKHFENRCKNPTGVFQKAVVPHLQPAALDLFIKETNRLFDRYKSTENEFLEMLAENRQWIVEGGPGTGKTFLALQRAQQLAESGDGQRVLFLCYNLILAGQITEVVSNLKLQRGEIVVKSWEGLVEDILKREDLSLEIPEDRGARYTYFSQEVPAYVSSILKENPPTPEFDALVIDEAQDHDTAFEDKEQARDLGWWSWYFALLKGDMTAPVALFLDQAQRPAFRNPEQFSLSKLRAALPASTHVRLRRVLRYTSQVHAYLANLPFPIAHEFAFLALPAAALPEGPEVVEASATTKALPDAIESIIHHWTGMKLCKVDDIVIMGFNRSLETSKSLQGISEIAGYPLVDYNHDGPRNQLRYIGIHRAKGLDFLGVILIDMAAPAVLADNEDWDRAETFFYGATRARQLLGVVGKESE